MKELARKRRQIPPINKVVQQLQALVAPGKIPHNLAVQWARELAQRSRLEPDFQLNEANMTAFLAPLLSPGPRRVLNGTGILLHTNLGRAPLDAAITHMALEQVQAYTDLELDLASGKRGHRDRRFAELMRLLWQVEDATLVNNAAAAVALTLGALAQGQETLVSRGELIEIGGSFRMPDIMAFAGTQLREVGTTNKTRSRDYQAAISAQTGCIFKAHPSNYRIEGFTLEAELADLTELGRNHQIPVVMDLGSGYSQLAPMHDVAETSIEQCLASRPDVLIFSGDKLLGGIQAGFILGTKAAVGAIRRHTMMRMVRVDKLTQAIVTQHLAKMVLDAPPPLATLANTPLEDLRQRGEAMLAELPAGVFQLEQGAAYLGGGSMPGQARTSIALVCRKLPAQKLADAARMAAPPLMGYIHKDAFYIDLATILPQQDGELLQVLKSLLA